MTGREEADAKRNIKIDEMLYSLPEFVSDWNNTMKSRGTQSTTRLDYIQKIRRFINKMDIEKPSDITGAVVTKWINMNIYKEDNPAKETSGAHRQAMWHAMKNLLMFLQESGQIDNVIKVSLDGKLRLGGTERPKGDNLEDLKNKRIIIGETEFYKLLNAVDKEPNSIIRYRDRAILSLFMTTGMRESALLEINIEDINFESLEMSYIDKRKQYFTRTMDEDVIRNLTDWIKVRSKFADKGKESQALFLSQRGNRLSLHALRSLLSKYSIWGLGYEITPHKLRSGFITIMYNHTHDIELVRRIIGHSNVTVTQRYIRVKNEDLETKRLEVLRSIFKNS